MIAEGIGGVEGLACLEFRVLIGVRVVGAATVLLAWRALRRRPCESFGRLPPHERSSRA